jgi:nucleotide-binding universal stress UspA family protein
MNKILIAFDAANFSEGAFRFASKLNEMQPCLLTAVFLSSIDYSIFLGYPSGLQSGFVLEMANADDTLIRHSEAHFKSLCEKNKIEYRIHEDVGSYSLMALRKESRFADLLIIGSQSFYKTIDNKSPNYYLKDVLHNAECPVLLVPEEFEFPENTILSYDGGDSSVMAIKMFSYLFPALCQNDTLLVYANQEDEHIPDEKYIEELLSRHYNNLTIHKLDIEPNEYFNVWLNGRKQAIIVAGSFGRTGLSQILRKSFILEAIKDHKMPIFIAHK